MKIIIKNKLDYQTEKYLFNDMDNLEIDYEVEE